MECPAKRSFSRTSMNRPAAATTGKRGPAQKHLTKWTDEKVGDEATASRRSEKAGTTRYLPHDAWEQSHAGAEGRDKYQEAEGVEERASSFVANTTAAKKAGQQGAIKIGQAVMSRSETSPSPT